VDADDDVVLLLLEVPSSSKELRRYCAGVAARN
jgi:hypothetical protein